VSLVGIKVLENVEIYLASVGVESVDELAPAFDQALKLGIVPSTRHL
jgi:hypothetical protein